MILAICIIGTILYTIIGLTCGFVLRGENFDRAESTMLGLLWPISMAFLIFVLLLSLLAAGFRFLIRYANRP